MVLGLILRSDTYKNCVRPILSQQHSNAATINLRFFRGLFESNGMGMHHSYTYSRPMALTSEKMVEKRGDSSSQNVPFYSLKRVILAARRILFSSPSGIGNANLAHRLRINLNSRTISSGAHFYPTKI